MVKTSYFNELECIVLENDLLQILVPKALGPRILSLRFRGGENLLAVLPDVTTKRPDGKQYHFFGGHRLWLAPEDPLLSYSLDDQAVEITSSEDGLLIRKAVELETGMEKSILLHLDPQQARLTLTHRLTNRLRLPVEYAPWAITQFRTGGIAILPQSGAQTGLLPNRMLTLWPYTDITSPRLDLGNQLILLHANMQTPFKIGFSNPRGWLAYWLDGVLFVKKAAFDPQGRYPDHGCSSECYCNQSFLELETLAPLVRIEPDASITHTETWELHSDIPLPHDESAIQAILQKIGLE